MADEQTSIGTFGANIEGVLEAMNAMKRGVKEAEGAVAGDVAAIQRILNALKKDGNLTAAFAKLDKRGQSSPYIAQQMEALKAYKAEVKSVADEVTRLQRVSAQGRPTPGPPRPTPLNVPGLPTRYQSPGYAAAPTPIAAALARAQVVAGNPGTVRSSEQVAADRAILASAEKQLAARDKALATIKEIDALLAESDPVQRRALGAAKIRADLEELRVATAKRTLKLEEDQANLNAQLVVQLERDLIAQKKKVAEDSAAALRNSGGILGGTPGGPTPPRTFGSGFYGGFAGGHGGGAAGLGFTLGQATKFGLIYGTMYRVLEETSRLFKDAFEQTVAYQKSVAELAFQTGQSSDAAGSLATQLQRTATQYGESGSAGIEAGQKALGVYGATGKSLEVQDATAVTAAKVVTQLAYVTGKPVDALVEGLGALTKAFGQGAESISAAADIAVKFGQIYHINAADLIAAAPKLAPLAETVGFTQKEAIALEAAAAARSGQTASQTVSNLDTLLAKGLSGPLIAEMAKLGIDPTKSVREQIFGNPKDEAQKSLAGLFNANPSLRGEILGAAGRGGSNRDFVASALEAAPEALKHANDTITEGSLDTITKLIQHTLGGAIRTLAGDAKNLSIELGKSGLFDVVGVLIVSLDQAIKLFNGVLGVFELFPRPIRDAAIALGLLAAAAKVGALSSLISKGGGAFAEGAVSKIATGQLGRVGADGAIIAGTRAATSGASIGAKLGAAGRGVAAIATGALGSTALISTGIGALLLSVGEAKVAYDKHAQSVEDATHAMILNRDANLSSADTANSAADSLSKAAQEARKGTGRYGVPGLGSYFGGHLDFGVNTDINGAALRGNILDTSAFLDKSIGARNQAKTEGLVANTGAFGNFSADAITLGFTQLKTAGFSAAEILRQFNSALDENGKVTDKAKAQQFDYANQAKAVYNTINSQALPDLKDVGLSGKTGVLLNNILGADTIPKFAAAAKAKGLTDSNLTSSAAFQTLAPIFDENGAKAVAAGLISQDDLDKLKSQFLIVVANQLAEDAKKRAEGSKVDVVRTVADALSQAANESATYQDALGQLNPGDSSGARALLDSHIKDLQKDIRLGLADKSDPDAAKKLAGLENDLRNLLIDKAKQDIAAAKAAFSAKSGNLTGAALSTSGLKLNKSILSQAIKVGDTEDVTSSLTNAGKAAAKAALKAAQNLYQFEAQNATTEDQLAAAKSKLDATTAAINAALGASDTPLQLKAAGQSAAASLTYNPVDDAQAAITSASAAIQKYQRDNPGVTNSVELIKLNGDLATATRNSAITAKQYATDIVTSQNDLRAAITGGDIASAQAAVADAKAEVARTTGDIVAHNRALAQLAQANQQQRDALLAFADIQRQLGSDSTDPVAQAKNAVDAANAKLKSDIKNHKGKDIIAQDKLTARTARDSLFQGKFDQGLSDAQTAHDLGQTSDTQYDIYLHTQEKMLRNRIAGLKKGSDGYRQATDDLNKILEAEKGLADGMNSQFNLGNIQIPTVYQARRFAQQVVGGPGVGAPGGTAGNNITVVFNGYDSDELAHKLEALIGTGNSYSTGGY